MRYLFLSLLISCQMSPNLNKIPLTEELQEVSGLSQWDETTLLMVQDEKGLIFFYDTEKLEVKEKIKFAGKGDYEGVEKISSEEIYVVQSDGDIFRVKKKKGEWETKKYKTFLSEKNDVEGLSYYAEENCLLVLCKEGDNVKGKKTKSVFAFDLDKKELKKKPFLTIDLSQLESKDYLPSAITYDVERDLFWVTDTYKQTLAQIDREGNVLDIKVVEGLPQPEGLAIIGKSLWIASEGETHGWLRKIDL